MGYKTTLGEKKGEVIEAQGELITAKEAIAEAIAELLIAKESLVEKRGDLMVEKEKVVNQEVTNISYLELYLGTLDDLVLVKQDRITAKNALLPFITDKIRCHDRLCHGDGRMGGCKERHCGNQGADCRKDGGKGGS